LSLAAVNPAPPAEASEACYIAAMHLLLTGFEPFGALPFNPSERIVREIARLAPQAPVTRLTTEIIPTEYDLAGRRIAERLAALQPDILLALGVAETRPEINLERVALNLDDAAKPDNAGALRDGIAIATQGPLARRTDWDLVPLAKGLRQAGFATTVSNYAGAYVCNHLYYCALAAIAERKLATRALFVHVPMIGEAWPLERLVAAIRWLMPRLAGAAVPVSETLGA
jgi:pyroglutamyl-peptidase